VLPQPARVFASALALATLAACGGRGRVADNAPVSPEAAVRALLNAVKANSIVAMRDLWGTERGPAAGYMNAREVEQRLTVIRSFLDHERFEFDQPNSVDPSNSLQRIVRVRLTRKGCQPVVPFTTVQWKSGWLVKNIDLSAAGNPVRACGDQAGPGT
jgi:hypothetical protein